MWPSILGGSATENSSCVVWSSRLSAAALSGRADSRPSLCGRPRRVASDAVDPVVLVVALAIVVAVIVAVLVPILFFFAVVLGSDENDG